MVEKSSIKTSKKEIFKVVQHIADVLESLMDDKKEEEKSIFTSPKNKREKMRPYVLNLFIKLELELSTMILALAYMDVFNTKIPLNKSNIHYSIATAMELASKFNEDVIFDYESISIIVGVNMKTLGQLEVEFLEAIDYELYMTTDLFDEYTSVLY